MKLGGRRATRAARETVGSAPSSAALHGLFVLYGVQIAAFFPFFALVLADRGLSPDRIGVAVAVMALARVVANPLWGNAADTRLGRRVALQVTSVGAGLAAGLLFFAGHGSDAVIGASALLALVGGASGPTLDALALDHLGPARMTEYGRIRAWESFSYAATNVVLGLLLQAAGVRWALVCYGACGVAVAAWAFGLRRDPPAHTAGSGRLGSVGAVFRAAPRLWGFLAGSLVLWTGFAAAWNFFALRIVGEGGGPLLVGIGAALGGMMEVVVMRLSAPFARRVGLRTVFAVGSLVYATAFLLWGLVQSATVLSALTMFEGMGFGLLFTSGVVIVGHLVPASLRATGQALTSTTSLGIAPILGGAAGGWAYQHLGAAILYSAASAFALCGGAIVWLVLAGDAFRRPVRAEELEAEVEEAAPPPPITAQ